MKIADSLVLIFGIPLYALVLSHPYVSQLALSLVGTGGWHGHWAVLAALLVCADGAWLVFTGPDRKRRFAVWIATLAAVAIFGSFAVPEAVFLTGLGVIFAIARHITLRRERNNFLPNLMVGAVGFGLAVFLTPVSTWMGMMAFLVTVWTHGLRPLKTPPDVAVERFRDSERLALGILRRFGS